MKASTSTATVALLTLVLAAGCDTGEPTADPIPDVAETTTAAVDTAPDVAETTTTAVEEVTEAEPRLAGLDLPRIILLTPGSGGGAHPVLEWEGVDGAATYSVTLYATNGRADWGWRGEDTSVIVGGYERQPSAGATYGPRVRDGMTWTVVAFDAAGAMVAQSGERPIGP